MKGCCMYKSLCNNQGWTEVSDLLTTETSPCQSDVENAKGLAKLQGEKSPRHPAIPEDKRQ